MVFLQLLLGIFLLTQSSTILVRVLHLLWFFIQVLPVVPIFFSHPPGLAVISPVTSSTNTVG